MKANCFVCWLKQLLYKWLKHGMYHEVNYYQFLLVELVIVFHAMCWLFPYTNRKDRVCRARRNPGKSVMNLPLKQTDSSLREWWQNLCNEVLLRSKNHNLYRESASTLPVMGNKTLDFSIPTWLATSSPLFLKRTNHSSTSKKKQPNPPFPAGFFNKNSLSFLVSEHHDFPPVM